MNGIPMLILTVSIQVSLLAIVLVVLNKVILRRYTKTSATLLAIGSMLIIAIGLAAFLPLPSWFDFVPELTSVENSVSESSSSSVDDLKSKESVEGELAADPLKTELAEQETGIVSGLHTLIDEMKNQSSTTTPVVPYPGAWGLVQWLAVLFFVAAGLGIVRLLIGLNSLQKLTRGSTLVEDSKVVELAHIIQAKIGCTQKIEIRQTSLISNAATTGWKRPRIFLGETFKQWDHERLQSVLAHEIAHVHHNDFTKNLISQICTALHFCNPFVHWLANRLRLSQEVAADQLAATLSSDRTIYAKTLAEMALHQENNRRPVFAHMFLPCEKTFIRRIKMLNQTTTTRSERPVWSFSIVTLMVALSICGLRVPTSDTPGAFGSSSLFNHASQTDEASLDYVSSNSEFVNIIRPAALLGNSDIKKLIEKVEPIKMMVEQQEKMFKTLTGLGLDEIDQVTYCQSGPRSDHPHTYVVVRSESDSRDKFREAADSFEESSDGDLLTLESARRSTRWMPYRNGIIVDDKTVIWAQNPEHLQFAVDVEKGDAKKSDWYPSWPKVGSDSFVFIGGRDFAKEISESMRSGGPSQIKFMTEEHIEDISKAQSIAFSADYLDKPSINLLVVFASKAQAESAKESAGEIVDLGKALIKPFARSADGPEKLYADTGVTALDNVKLALKKNVLQATSTFDLKIDTISSMSSAIRKSAQRTQSANNVRQMALAFHNYHDATGKFPPAVLYSETGKAYSWRIAILPYVEEQAIYDSYNFDEDWDSEHNLEVTKNMPEFFRHPAMEESTNTNYFAVVGDETIFGDAGGTDLREIRDGTSNTILFVESKKEVHWADPQDISYDEAVKGDMLGGLSEKGFNAAFADGSVHFLPTELDREILEALLSSSGGEIIDHDRIRN